MNQISLVIGAFMLLSLLTISVNKSIIQKADDTYQSESVITASTLAQAMLEEVTLRAFDQNTDTASVSTAAGLTAAASLGKEYGEIYPTKYNDIDDFNGFRCYDTCKVGIFKDSVVVTYANPNFPDSTSNSQTFYKKITVRVINVDTTKMKVPVLLTTVVTY
mgnify:CR=1 FL=1